MATINIKMMDSALQDGKIGLHGGQTHLNRSVQTMIRIYRTIAASDGLDLDQLQDILNLDRNTIKIYTKWLRDRLLVEGDPGEGRKIVLRVSSPSTDNPQILK